MWIEINGRVATEEGSRIHCWPLHDARPTVRESLNYLARLLENSLDGCFLDALKVQAHCTVLTLEIAQWTSFVASRSNSGLSIGRNLPTRFQGLAAHSCGNCLRSPPTGTASNGTRPPSG